MNPKTIVIFLALELTEGYKHIVSTCILLLYGTKDLEINFIITGLMTEANYFISPCLSSLNLYNKLWQRHK